MNTRLSYRYSDKMNCKQYTSVIVEGTLTWEQVEPWLTSHGFFIPGQVGLEDLQYRFALPGADHPWHQLLPGDFKPTDAAPTIAISADELAERFAHTVWTPDWRTVKVSAVRTEQAIPPNTGSDDLNSTLSTTLSDLPASKRTLQPSRAKKRA